MSQLESSEPIPETDAVSPKSLETEVADAEAPEAEPEPEPMTPERVLEWNSYYDKYVAGCVLFLLFVAAAHRIFDSRIWSQLKAGQWTLRRGPLVSDPFSFSMQGARWINVSWLYELLSHVLYRVGSDDRLNRRRRRR